MTTRRALAAPALMVLSTLLFSLIGVAVKFASQWYDLGELVFYRSAIGALMIAASTRLHGQRLATRVPGMHFWRSACGVAALVLWFHSIEGLPLGTAMALNSMSSVWMALFLIGGAIMLGADRVDGRLVFAVLVGFAGVALVLRPTMDTSQAGYGLSGVMSGVLAAMAYLQITALGRAGEPDVRVVFYFCLAGMVAGAALASLKGWHAHTLQGAALVLSIGVLATVAQTLMTRAYTTGATLTNASLHYLGILFSCLFGVVLFGDRLDVQALLGMVLIVAAGVGSTWLQAHSRRAARPTPLHPTET